MQNSTHVSWIGRLLTITVAILVGSAVVAGTATAQTTVYTYDDRAGWWDHLSCDQKQDLMAQDTANNEDDDDFEDRVCLMYDELDGADEEDVDDIHIGSDTATGRHASNEEWWDDGLDTDCAAKLNVVGMTEGTAYVTGNTPKAPAPVDDYCSIDYDDLHPRDLAYVDAAGNALSGQSGMTTTDEEEAPAIPLVGIGILGLLLAGRGAWLRRSRA